MFESLRMNIGKKLAVMKFRKVEDPVISFTQAISKSKQTLIIMPLDRRELLATMGFIEMIRKTLAEENITVVADEHGLETIRLMPKSHFIHIKESDMTAFYHPRQEFLSRMKNRKFDLAIDLNLDLVLPSGYICRESNAKIRVGFKGPQSDAFYNFQVQPDLALTRRNIYDRVAQCLHMF